MTEDITLWDEKSSRDYFDKKAADAGNNWTKNSEVIFVTPEFLQFVDRRLLQLGEGAFVFLGMAYDIVGQKTDGEGNVQWYKCKRRDE